jgi:hypothetical protein
MFFRCGDILTIPYGKWIETTYLRLRLVTASVSGAVDIIDPSVIRIPFNRADTIRDIDYMC